MKNDTTKELIDALDKVPELVKAAETFEETSNHIITTLSEAIRQRPQATIANEELNKLREAITSTRCV